MFEKFRRKNDEKQVYQQMESSREQGGDTVYTWDNLAQEAPAFNANNESEMHRNQQYDKLAAALLTGDSSIVGQANVMVSDADKQVLIERMASGQIGEEQERNVLENIVDPVHKKGVQEVASTIAMNSHERKILSWVASYSPDRFDSSYVSGFLDQFPTPIDFQERKTEFLEMIRANNPDAKFQEYVADMDQFCRDIYGKRQEYFERMQELNSAVDEYRQRNIDQYNQYKQYDQAPTNNEYERQAGNPFLDFGGAIASKANLRGEMNGKPSEDSAYMDQNGFMAVFDGVGGSNDGAAASSACRDAMPSLLQNVDFSKPEERQLLVDRLNQQVVSGDATTCVITKTEKNPDGTSTLHYISVGDSRLYVIRNDVAYQITRDDSVTEEMLNQQGITDPARRKQLLLHGITNNLGNGYHGASEGNNNSVVLYPGDKIMLCSDGITGDTPAHMLDQNDIAKGKRPDVMSNEEIVQIIKNSGSCQEASQNLINNAKKFDDRTALVAAI